MHVLIIPSGYFVTEKDPLSAIFQLEQGMALLDGGIRVGILSVSFLREEIKPKDYPYKKYENIKGMNIYRNYKYLSTRSELVELGVKLKRKITKNNIGHKFDNYYLQGYFEATVFRIFKIYIKKHGMPDIIHAHNFLNAGRIALFLKKNFNIPFMLTEHSTGFARGIYPASLDSVFLEIAKDCSYLSCVSSVFKNLLEKRLNIEFFVFPNIVDKRFFREPLKKAENSKNFIFLNVAIMDEKKNQSLLVRAFAKGFRNTDTLLVIAGEGPLFNKLNSLAKELEIENQVVITGALSREEVLSEMLKANCFILTSKFETFGVVLIEALASGLPLIATKSGGPEDIVNENNGILIDTDNENQLINAMQKIVKNRQNYNPENLREEARTKYGSESFFKRTENIYKKILDVN